MRVDVVCPRKKLGPHRHDERLERKASGDRNHHPDPITYRIGHLEAIAKKGDRPVARAALSWHEMGASLDVPSESANGSAMGRRSYLVLDIETVLDLELPVTSESEGLPAPPHHEVVCIGVLWLSEDHEVRRMGVLGEDKDEAGMLLDFTRFIDKQQPCMVTFNGRGFDLPVIAARCMKHGLAFAHYYGDRDVRYRFSATGHLDLMDFLSDFGSAKRSGLDITARLCGMPGKVGVDGKAVGPLIHAGRLDEVKAYCLCDVVQTAAVLLRTQLLRGEVTRNEYLKAMRSLMNAALADTRLGAVTRAWDVNRLLLGESLGEPDEVASLSSKEAADPVSEAAT